MFRQSFDTNQPRKSKSKSKIKNIAGRKTRLWLSLKNGRPTMRLSRQNIVSRMDSRFRLTSAPAPCLTSASCWPCPSGLQSIIADTPDQRSVTGFVFCSFYNCKALMIKLPAKFVLSNVYSPLSYSVGECVWKAVLRPRSPCLFLFVFSLHAFCFSNRKSLINPDN